MILKGSQRAGGRQLAAHLLIAITRRQNLLAEIWDRRVRPAGIDVVSQLDFENACFLDDI